MSVLSLALAGCPDPGSGPDARIRFDACTGAVCTPDADLTPPIDGGPDADLTPDAKLDTFSASLSVQEVNINGIPQLGQGLNVSLNFYKNPKPYDFEESPGLTGCKVTEYTVAELANEATQNEGVLTITAGDGDPAIPPCVVVPGQGYRCIGASGAGMATVSTGPPFPAGTAAYTIVGATFTAADTGRYLNIGGLADAANNGAFPIVQVAGATTIVVGNPAGVANAVPAGVMYATIAGVGPIPGLMDPGLLEDDDTFTVALDSTMGGGAGDWESFSQAMITTGDDFDLDTASQTQISNIPVDGSAFTLDCAGAGGSCGVAFGTIVAITTTDGSVAGLAPYTMPPPATKQVSIRCAQIGTSAINVSAAVSAFLMTSGATRIQVTYLRDNLSQPPGVTHAVTIVTGHGTIGFTTP